MKTHYFVVTTDPRDHARKYRHAEFLMAKHRIPKSDVLIIRAGRPIDCAGYDLSSMIPLDGLVETIDSIARMPTGLYLQTQHN